MQSAIFLRNLCLEMCSNNVLSVWCSSTTYRLNPYFCHNVLGKPDLWRLIAKNNPWNALTADDLPFVKVQYLADKMQCRKVSRNSSRNRTRNREDKKYNWFQWLYYWNHNNTVRQDDNKHYINSKYFQNYRPKMLNDVNHKVPQGRGVGWGSDFPYISTLWKALLLPWTIPKS